MLPPMNEAPAATGDVMESVGNSEGQRLGEQLRMLQDGKGRLLYLGDSASLSYLDTIRRLVESTIGPCNFTNDVHKGKLVEGSISTGLTPTYVLPDKEAADFLLESFFSNTVGTILIFDRQAFTQEVQSIYDNPLQTKQSRLSILNLVFAVGLQLVMSSDVSSSRQRQILERLDGGSVSRAEMFYVNATHLNDPVSGFEDGDITSIQALLLVTVFMLTVAKRNAAWAYLGMAIRSAYALGLHRKRSDFSFTAPEQRVRRNVWRSLYVMDCFLSAMLGRPNGIHCRDATDSLAAGNDSGDLWTSSDDTLELASISASVRASCLVGDILSNIYADRKISTELAHAISNKFQACKDSLPTFLHWQNIDLPDEDPKATLAQLHRVSDEIRALRDADGGLLSRQTHELPETDSAKSAPFQAACVRSALYTINAVQAALLKRALPRRDPFVIYWLFTAALIICTNGFCAVYHDIDNKHAMYTALNLHRHFGEVDPLARRFLEILLAFSEAIEQDTVPCAVPTGNRSKQEAIFSALFGVMHYGTKPANVDDRTQPQAGSSRGANVPSGNQPGGIGFQSEMGQGNGQQIPLEPDSPHVSPPDYSLDFDAFLMNVTEDPYQQDLWTPLYGITDTS
ncbi:hypothetical protein V501_05175 [Pseudogymnoascus sp. VKM F-4519 (FW-2642)]|nr:hypothetical protein V501_05175 [Pseudogymnoascus sp. VKM F-4519 (FW-2642)]